ncbi:hypothetical protein TNCV_2865751 [Trichonephila clavipes]|nr:hypothetical protein TNCV_2865751 [Trichonephila clavipes]
MIRPLSNSLNSEKCLLAHLRGMFRLPKSSYNRRPRPNISISTPDVSRSSSSTQVQLLTSTSSIAATNSEPQPPIPTSDDAPSTNDMFLLVLNHIPQSYPLPHPSPLFNHRLNLRQYRMPRKYKKLEPEKGTKELRKKMNDAII